MVKFGRTYFLSIQENTPPGAPQKFLTVQLPFTIEFDINRNSLGSVNTAKIRIYNLSPKNSNLILKNWNDYDRRKLVTLYAGYGNVPGVTLPIIFTGNASQVQTVREGTNYITTIQAFDGGLAFSTGDISITVPQDIQRASLISQMIQTLRPLGLTQGAIGKSFNDVIPAGSQFSGSTMDILTQLTGGQAFVDNGRVNCLAKQNGEVIKTPTVPIINSASGLLGTPMREQTHLNFDSLFEPSLVVGQQVFLQSLQQFNYNTTYSVISLRHNGTISGAVCGDATTSIGVFCNALTPIPVVPKT